MNAALERTLPASKKAWVVFSGQADLAWLKILKPGFRHCSLIINDGQRWISYDPLSSHSEITAHHLPADFNLPLWMQERGHIVLPARISQPKGPAPIGLFSCVEAVKRVLGIHARMIVTPWQLHQYLTRTHDVQSIKGDFAWEA